MSFRILAWVMAVAGCLLGLRFILVGNSVLTEWGLDLTAGGEVLGRRLGAIYLGVALAFFVGRSAAPSELRSMVCLVTAGTVAVLSGLGVFEFVARRVSVGIFRSVVAEAILAACFVWVWWRGK